LIFPQISKIEFCIKSRPIFLVFVVFSKTDEDRFLEPYPWFWRIFARFGPFIDNILQMKPGKNYFRIRPFSVSSVHLTSMCTSATTSIRVALSHLSIFKMSHVILIDVTLVWVVPPSWRDLFWVKIS
jgi:hypothetical protein